MSKIAALLLAAGRSERMGAFKPLLPFGDKTVIETCVSYLLDGGVGDVIVVAGPHEAEIREQLDSYPVSFARNAEPNSEMGVTIIRGVEEIPADAEAVFVSLCDQPAIPAEVIKHLIEERDRSGATLLVPVHDGRRGHPVLIDLKFRKELLNLDRQRGLRAFFEANKQDILAVPISSPYIARDMDTWDDYRELYTEVFHTEPPISP